MDYLKEFVEVLQGGPCPSTYSPKVCKDFDRSLQFSLLGEMKKKEELRKGTLTVWYRGKATFRGKKEDMTISFRIDPQTNQVISIHITNGFTSVIFGKSVFTGKKYFFILAIQRGLPRRQDKISLKYPARRDSEPKRGGGLPRGFFIIFGIVSLVAILFGIGEGYMELQKEKAYFTVRSCETVQNEREGYEVSPAVSLRSFLGYWQEEPYSANEMIIPHEIAFLGTRCLGEDTKWLIAVTYTDLSVGQIFMFDGEEFVQRTDIFPCSVGAEEEGPSMSPYKQVVKVNCSEDETYKLYLSDFSIH